MTVVEPLEPLERLGAKVYCFGSRVRGKGAKYSDLDLMVVADQRSIQQLVKSARHYSTVIFHLR